jgi:hypothetical protein
MAPSLRRQTEVKRMQSILLVRQMILTMLLSLCRLTARNSQAASKGSHLDVVVALSTLSEALKAFSYNVLSSLEWPDYMFNRPMQITSFDALRELNHACNSGLLPAYRDACALPRAVKIAASLLDHAWSVEWPEHRLFPTQKDIEELMFSICEGLLASKTISK